MPAGLPRCQGRPTAPTPRVRLGIGVPTALREGMWIAFGGKTDAPVTPSAALLPDGADAESCPVWRAWRLGQPAHPFSHPRADAGPPNAIHERPRWAAERPLGTQEFDPAWDAHWPPTSFAMSAIPPRAYARIRGARDPACGGGWGCFIVDARGTALRDHADEHED